MGRILFDIGIDFGTTFTKAAYYDPVFRKSIIIFYKNGRDKTPFLSSNIIYNKKTKKLSMIDKDGQRAPKDSQVIIDFLKMRIANRLDGNIDGLDPGPLSLFYLSSVLRNVRSIILESEKKRIKKQDIVWSGSICVPVADMKTDIEQLFSRIFTLAWEISFEKPNDEYEYYHERFNKHIHAINLNDSNFLAYPEIAAAIQSFASSREAQPGVYLYFDIGGGTVDAVSFLLKRNGDDIKIRFYEGAVESLGLDRLTRKICIECSKCGIASVNEKIIRDALISGKPTSPYESYFPSEDVTNLTSRIVYNSRQKDGNKWSERMDRLPIFIGGGGAHCVWYKNEISLTHGRRSLRNFSIPPFHLQDVYVPNEMKNIDPLMYNRLTIAHGLSIDMNHRVEIEGFPSDFHPIRKNNNYNDFNDKMWERQRERYGKSL